MSFTISDVNVKPSNSVEKMSYNELHEYYTFNSSTNMYTWESEYNIVERHSTINPTFFDEWMDAVIEYIGKYNSRLPGKSIKYEITASRNNAMYQYKKYDNNVLVGEGWADYGMIPEDERKEWSNKVVEFRKANNLPLPGDAIKQNLQVINTISGIAETTFDRDYSGNTPSIPSALQTLTHDPCKFPSEISVAVKTGPVGPLDRLRNKIDGVKEKINQDILISTDDFNTAVGPTLKPVTETVQRQVETRTDETETREEYFRKKFAKEESNFKKIMEREPIVESEEDIILSYGNNKYEIPSWMRNNITAAMKKRFKNGIPDKDTISNYNKYKAQIMQIFTKYNIPVHLSVLAIIENNAKLYSSENGSTAKGMWQITRPNGAAYGILELDKYGNVVKGTDKRTEFTPSTEVAAKMLKKFRTGQKYDNWIYTAAAYNGGQVHVNKSIRRNGKGASIWEVWKGFYDESRFYVCLLIGLCEYFGYSTDTLFE